MSLSAMKRPAGSVIGLLCSHFAVPCAVADNKGDPGDELDEADSFALKPERRDMGLDSGFQSSDDDASLPASPDGPPRTILDRDRDALELETRQLVGDFYRIYVGGKPADTRPHNALPTMRKVVDEVLRKHQISFKSMVQKLVLQSQNEKMAFVTAVAKNIFKDGTTNWGRIASLVAFGAVVCRELKAIDREDCVETVTTQICTYLATEQREWFVNNSGWVGFVDFFHVEDPETVVWNTLIAVAGFAGLGAGLALMIR
ncbi:induced myeloid leukemia cell differentiation protein Mcl-1 homolog [Denticeps clupeoides]|uniref:Bcl-2 Bcl-2 homology region 1-3 domain-containing protein n=1 Tax=Denticeps clupeoides TaxID=299321 RepID=A0AAY4EJZ3_9TELE|nr:induced myeloid leukemia cell differentiation protein Mcl-1 homolog [Denticeps clupeoides]